MGNDKEKGAVAATPAGTPDTRSKAVKAAKNPCGRCRQECVSGNSIPCGGACNFSYHQACVDGMTPEYIDNCEKIDRIYGGSSFLCMICRNVIGFMNNTFKAQQDEMKEIKGQMKANTAEHRVTIERLKAVEAENRLLAEKVKKLETNAEQVKSQVVGIETGMEAGMEKALMEVQQELVKENEEKDKKATNLVIHGAAESTKETKEEVNADEEETVLKLAEAMEVDIEGDIKVMYRAGAKRTDGKPRPLVVKVSHDETRERLIRNGNRLARKDEWRRVFISLDLTFRQREEARKLDAQLFEEADKKTEEAKKEGRMGGRYRVVGQRGRKKEEGGRRIEWRDDRE